MITTPTVSGKPGQAPTGLSCDLYPLIGSHSTWTDPRGPVTGTVSVTLNDGRQTGVHDSSGGYESYSLDLGTDSPSSERRSNDIRTSA